MKLLIFYRPINFKWLCPHSCTMAYPWRVEKGMRKMLFHSTCNFGSVRAPVLLFNLRIGNANWANIIQNSLQSYPIYFDVIIDSPFILDNITSYNKYIKLYVYFYEY